MKQKRTRYLIKEQAFNKTINDALKLKDDLNNFSSFKDHSTNQLFFVCTSEQLYKVLDEFKSDLDLNKNIYLEDEIEFLHNLMCRKTLTQGTLDLLYNRIEELEIKIGELKI